MAGRLLLQFEKRLSGSRNVLIYYYYYLLIARFWSMLPYIVSRPVNRYIGTNLGAKNDRLKSEPQPTALI